MQQKISPPSLATKILFSFLKPALREEVFGDLEEQFLSTVRKKSLRRAKLNYWFQILHYFRPFAIKKSKLQSNYQTMVQHAFTLSIRNFLRYKSSFFINLIGLSTGLACALLIGLWVNDELLIDKFHARDAHLYQIMESSARMDGIKTQPSAPDMLAETIIQDLPEIAYSVAVTPSFWFGKFLLINGTTNLKATGEYASKDFFNVFSYPLLHGDPNHALDKKTDIAISQELSMKLFKTTDNVIGKTFDVQILNFKGPFSVSAVFAIPEKSSEQVDFVLSFEAWKDLSAGVGRSINWDNHGPYAYVVVKDNTDINQFNAKLAGYLKTKSPNTNVIFFATPYSDRYLHGTYENGKMTGGRIDYVKLFSVIALFILGIACINFMNLSTARASRRLKEVGVKKAIGASRAALVAQYLTESMMLTLISLGIALLLVTLFIPPFNIITGKHLSLHFDFRLLGSLSAIALITGVIAGSYPAIYLSGFNAADILRGKIASSFAELIARKGLVIFQFTLSIILIVSVAVVYRQIEFIQTRNLGYDKDNIILVAKEGKLAENQESFLAEAKKLPGVANTTAINSTLMGGNSSTTGLNWEGKDPESVITFENITADYDIIETLGVKIKEGRSFSRDHKTDDMALILNESAVAVMGLTNPIGKKVVLWGENNMEIIGVVKDFHFESLHKPVTPLFFLLNAGKTLQFMVRSEPGHEREVISGLTALYEKFSPGFTFEYKFLDDEYQNQYQSERRVGALSQYFAGFAILISCLGLFGLAAFTAERRIKEIGIRKVMGSSVTSIVLLLTSEFTKIVVISIAIALPICYFGSKWWLGRFAFHFEPGIALFAGAGLAALVVAWLTVGIQTFKAARVNPTECLKEQ